MAVIINEMEVVVEQPGRGGPEGQQPSAAAPGPGAPGSAQLSPRDLQDVMRWQAERAARLLAD